MKPGVRFAVLAVVVLAVAGVLAVKYRQQRQPSSRPAPLGIVVAAPERASVLLFADLREAGEGEDGCALIIRTVRSARQRGVSVTEYDAGSSPDVRKKYRVVVDPTVIVLDARGHEIARHEREDSATIAAIRADIARVSGGAA